MINKLPDLIEEDIKYGISAIAVLPEDFNLTLVYPPRLLTADEIKQILKTEGII
jgi:hypothetical protein